MLRKPRKLRQKEQRTFIMRNKKDERGGSIELIILFLYSKYNNLMDNSVFIYDMVRKYLQEQYLLHVATGFSTTISAQDVQFNNFASDVLLKYLKYKKIVQIINSRFNFQTASSQYYKNQMLNDIAALWGNQQLSDQLKSFFMVWGQHQQQLNNFDKIEKILDSLLIQQIPLSKNENRLEIIKHLVESSNKIHKHLSSLQLHCFQHIYSTNYQYDKIQNLVQSTNIYQMFLVVAASSQDWCQLKVPQKDYLQLYNNNKYKIHKQIKSCMESIVEQRHQMFQLKHKIINFQKKYGRQTNLNNFKQIQAIVGRGLQASQQVQDVAIQAKQQLQDVALLIGQIANGIIQKKQLKTTSYYIKVAQFQHQLLKQCLKLLLQQIQKLYPDEKIYHHRSKTVAYDNVTLQQMRDFINRIAFLLDPFSNHQHLIFKMNSVEQKLKQLLEKNNLQQISEKNKQIEVLKEWIKYVNGQFDQIFQFVLPESQKQSLSVILQQDKQTDIFVKMEKLKYLVKNMAQQNKEYSHIKQSSDHSVMNNVQLAKDNSFFENMREQKKQMMKNSSQEESVLQKSILWKQWHQRDNILLTQKQQEIKSKSNQIRLLKQQLNQLKQTISKTQHQQLYKQVKPTFTTQSISVQTADAQHKLKQHKESQQHAELVSINVKLTMELQKLREQKKQTKEKINQLQEQLQIQRTNGLKYKKQHQRNNSLQEKLLDDQDVITSLQEELKSTKEKLQSSQKQLQIIKSTKCSQKSTEQNQSMKMKIYDLNLQLQVAMQTNSREKESQQSQKIKNEKDKNQLKESKQLLEKQIQTLKQHESQLTLQQQENKATISHLQEHLQGSLTEIKRAQTKVQQLEDQLEQKDKQLTVLKETSKSHIIKIQHLQSTLVSKQQELSRCIPNRMSEQKYQQYQEKQQIFNEKAQINEKLMVPYTASLFNQQIFFKNDYDKQTLVNHIQNYSKSRIVHTSLIHKYDTRNKTNFHQYIDNVKNLCLVIKTQYSIIAGFYPGIFQQKQTLNKGGLLVSATNNKSYTLYPKKQGDKTTYRGMVYDQYYAIFGNAQIRIKTGLKTVFSNFGINNSFFNPRGDKIDMFLNEGDKREVEFEYCQFFKILFENERLNHE